MTDETRRGEEKRDFFRKSLSDFSFFADIPNVRNRSRTADATKKWRFFLRISIGFRFCPQIYPVRGTSLRTVVGVKSDDFFRESLPDCGIFCRYTLCASDADWTNAVGGGEKKRDFLRKYRQFPCLFPDIPCVQCGCRDGGRGDDDEKRDFLRNPLPDSKKSADIPDGSDHSTTDRQKSDFFWGLSANLKIFWRYTTVENDTQGAMR